jgi:hypothetical protein
MSALQEFECHPAIGGYRVATFDQRKFVSAEFDFETGKYVGPPLPGVTADERYVLELSGSFATADDDEPEVIEVLVPASDRTKGFDLFDSDPAAFLKFANIPTTFEGVKAFADRFGQLHHSRVSLLDNWYWTIREMRRAVMAWEKADAIHEFSGLMRLIKRHGERNFHGGGVNVRLKEDPLTRVPRLCLRPDDLLDALWVQLFLAIDGSQNLRTCSECRTWFTVQAGRGRSDKEYCSDACRMRAYRKRRKDPH